MTRFTIASATVVALLFSASGAVAASHAIAYDNRTGILGYAQDASTRSAAQDAALSTCERSGGANCRVVWQAAGSVCVALAATGEDSYTIVESGSISGAETAALGSCEQDFGEACYLEISFCGN